MFDRNRLSPWFYRADKTVLRVEKLSVCWMPSILAHSRLVFDKKPPLIKRFIITRTSSFDSFRKNKISLKFTNAWLFSFLSTGSPGKERVVGRRSLDRRRQRQQAALRELLLRRPTRGRRQARPLLSHGWSHHLFYWSRSQRALLKGSFNARGQNWPLIIFCCNL